MNPWSLHARSPESSMDPISVQIGRLSVQITGPWTISSAFFAEIPSMDPVLMHAIVQGPRIGAEEPEICADIGSMDEFESEYVRQTVDEPSNGDSTPASVRQVADEPTKAEPASTLVTQAAD